jgi:hypothetical protein
MVPAASPSRFTMTSIANPAGRKQSLKNVRLRKHADYQRAYAAVGIVQLVYSGPA